MIGVVLGLLLGGAALAAVAVARKRSSGASGSTARTAAGARVEDAAAKVEREHSKGLFSGSEVQMEWAAAGGAAGGAVAGLAFGTALGPVGALIGTAVGLFVGAFASAIGQPSFPRVVRDALADWLRSESLPSSSLHVDALLFRDALVGTVVWVNGSALAVEIELRSGVLIPSLARHGSNANTESLLPSPVATQIRQNTLGESDGMRDGPNRRRAYRAWVDGWRRGALYPIDLAAAPRDSWRTPGYVWTRAVWPLVSYTPLRSVEGWSRVAVTRENVEALAVQTFDAVNGLSWKVEP